MLSSMGVQRWFVRRPEIELIHWPSKSPDLNVIELIWAKLKQERILRYGNNPPRNAQKLWDKVWKSGMISLRTTTYLCQAVIDAGGMWTKY